MMGEWQIRIYKAEDRDLWNELVAKSRQGTLLHYRNYMDYHAGRFQDCSLIAFRKNTPIAILPANRVADKQFSHQGLTYAGWLTPVSHFDGADMLCLFDAWVTWCKENGIREIYYKATPHIYHHIPAEEDIYALFRYGATPWITNLSSVIDLRVIPIMNTLQKRHLKKSQLLNPWIRETNDVTEFMPVLAECLESRHGATPIHTTIELQTLKDRFPGNVRLFLCGIGSEIEAEVCIFDTNGVAHCQYLATTEAGRCNGTLTHLLYHLIMETFAQSRYFDFGTSNEEAGKILNSGLLHQKVGLGGRGVVYQSFFIRL